MREGDGNFTIQSELFLTLDVVGTCPPFFTTPSMVQAVILLNDKKTKKQKKTIRLPIYLMKSQITPVNVIQKESVMKEG